MKLLKTVAIVVTLFAGVSAANATTLVSFGDISSAQGASVVTVNATEAKLLGYDNDVASIQARIQGNKWLVDTIERQGFSVDRIVGATGGQNDLTLYAL